MDDLLYLTHRLPCLSTPADQSRCHHVLTYLSRHFRVHLGCFVDDGAWQQVEAVRALCASSCFIGLHPARARLRSLRGLLPGQMMGLRYYHDARLANWVGRKLSGGHIGRALASSAPMAQYLLAPGGPAPQRVIDFSDGDKAWHSHAAVAPAWLLESLRRREQRRMLAYQTRIVQQFDGATCVSEAQASALRLRLPEARHKLEYFNNGIDSEHFSPLAPHRNPYPDGSTVLIFAGAMDHMPNIEAATWFAGAVLPMLRSLCPELRFCIVGACPSAATTALAGLPGVMLTGAVADVRPYLAHALLAVAPARAACGLLRPVLEAMAMQKTVVGSALAFDGLGARFGSELLLANTADEFVLQIAGQLRGRVNRSLGLAARQRILQDYRWDHNLTRLGAMLGLPAARQTAPPRQWLGEPVA